jgi:hypothetical protein
MRLHGLVSLLTLGTLISVVPPAVLAQQATPAGSTGQPEIVRTLLYRDLTSKNESVQGAYNAPPALSDDGSTTVYEVDRADGPNGSVLGHIFRLAVDGGQPTAIDTVPAPRQIDVSADGGTAVVAAGANGQWGIRIAGAGTAGWLVLEDGGVETSQVSISGDGRTIFFTLHRDTHLKGVSDPTPAGLWTIKANGSGLRQLVGRDDVARLIDAKPDDPIFFGDTGPILDSSFDGSRVTFAARNYTSGLYYVLGTGGDGGNPHVIYGPVNYIGSGAVSADGTTVAIHTRPTPFGSGPGEYAVSSFDGGGRRVLTTDDAVGEFDRIDLNRDGTRVLLGGSGLLYAADGSGVVALAAGGCGSGLVGGGLTLATMDAAAKRVAYLANDGGVVRLALLEVDPADPGPTPGIDDITLEPPSIEAGKGSSSATVSAKFSPPDATNCVTFLRDGRRDTEELSPSFVTLSDNGRSGDTTAGDGVFTSAGIVALATATTGPRTVRIHAEIRDADGRRRAVAIEIGELDITAGVGS